jgi:hypothetical protein
LLSVKQKARQRTKIFAPINPTRPTEPSEPSAKPAKQPTSGQVTQTTSRLLEVKRRKRTGS